MAGSDLGDYLSGKDVKQLIVGRGEEPIRTQSANQEVRVGIAVNRRWVKEERAVQPAGQAAIQVTDAGGVAGIGPAPLGREGVQSREVMIEIGGTADEDVLP